MMRVKEIYTFLIFALPLIFGLTTFVVAQETSGNYQGGSIKVGYDSRTCDSSLAGSIRFNSSTNSVQVCGGVSWTTWGS